MLDQMMRRNCRVSYNPLLGPSPKWTVSYEGLGKSYLESASRTVFSSWNGVLFPRHYTGTIIYWSSLHFRYSKVESLLTPVSRVSECNYQAECVMLDIKVVA